MANEWKLNGGNNSAWNCETSDSRGFFILQTKNCRGKFVFDNTNSQNGRIIKKQHQNGKCDISYQINMPTIVGEETAL